MKTKLKNYPFWALCIALCAGVFLGSFFNFITFYSISFCIAIVCLIFLFNKVKPILFISIACFAFICIGAIRFQISVPESKKNHISNLQLSNTTNKVVFKVVEEFKPSKNYLKYTIQLKKVDNYIVKGNAILSLKKDSITTLKLGNTYIGLFKLYKLNPSGNPYVFEYSNHLKKQQITHQAWTNSSDLFVLQTNLNHIENFKFKIQKHLQDQLQKSKLNNDVKAFTAALVLGNRTRLSTELKDSFIDAGVIHILAISGLHIGILFFILNSIFKLIFPKFKNGICNAVFVISILWFYVWFIGSSPSAIRATTMFTCFQISRLILREQHPINALFLSILILVLHNPFILFTVGFQLSISAVAAIILGMPIFTKFWFPKNVVLNKLWTITAVSICAQIGILPFSIYYFHQFSGVFLIANIPIMLVIPIILVAALMIVFLCGINFTPAFFFNIYNKSILHVFNYIEWISTFKILIFKNIYMNLFSFFCLTCILIFIIYFIYLPKKALQLWSIPIALLFTSIFIEITITLKKNEVWILNTYKNLVVSELNSKQLTIHSVKPISQNELTYIINPIRHQLHYKNIKFNNLKNSYQYKRNSIFILTNKSEVLFIPPRSIVVLYNSPKINLERFITKHKPKQIIISNHNYPSFIKKWKSTCKKLQVDFYDINEKGAFKLTNY